MPGFEPCLFKPATAERSSAIPPSGPKIWFTRPNGFFPKTNESRGRYYSGSLAVDAFSGKTFAPDCRQSTFTSRLGPNAPCQDTRPSYHRDRRYADRGGGISVGCRSRAHLF